MIDWKDMPGGRGAGMKRERLIQETGRYVMPRKGLPQEQVDGALCFMNPDPDTVELGCASVKFPRRPFLNPSPNTTARIPEPDLQAEIKSLVSVSPEFVADSSRNYVRLYVRDLQMALRQMMERAP
jgi:hypothetical protein